MAKTKTDPLAAIHAGCRLVQRDDTEKRSGRIPQALHGVRLWVRP